MQTLERICSTLHEISLSLLDSVNLKSLTTLFVENLFVEIRKWNAPRFAIFPSLFLCSEGVHQAHYPKQLHISITQVARPTTPSKLGFYHLLNSLQCRNLVEPPQWRGNNWMRWEHGKQSMGKVCGCKPLKTWPPRILLEHYRWTVIKAKKQIQSQYVDFTELGRGEQEIIADEKVAPDQSSDS